MKPDSISDFQPSTIAPFGSGFRVILGLHVDFSPLREICCSRKSAPLVPGSSFPRLHPG